MSNLDLGLVTAYGYALSQGFTGTETEFAQMLANVVIYKQAAENAANNAALSAGLAEQYKDEAFDTTPAGYEDFVSETNSSLGYLAETGIKNFCNPTAGYTNTINGVTFKPNGDGTYTVNGTATGGNAIQYLEALSDNYNVDTALKISGSPSGASNTGYSVRIYNSSGNAVGTDFESQGIFQGQSQLRIAIVVINGTTVNNLVFKPMVTLASVPNSDYAHYVPHAQSNAALTEKTRAHAYEITAGENITINRHSLCKIGNVLIGTVSFKSSVANPTHILNFGSKPLNGRTDIPFYSIGNRALVGFLLADSSSFAIDKNEGSIEADTNYMFNVALIMSE